MTKLDELVTQIALTLHQSAPDERWAGQAYRIAVPEDGSYRAEVYSYWLSDGSLAYDVPSEPGESQIGQLAMNCWRQTVELGLPRWYMMTVSLQASGKYAVDFEYRDDYQEGDITKLLD